MFILHVLITIEDSFHYSYLSFFFLQSMNVQPVIIECYDSEIAGSLEQPRHLSKVEEVDESSSQEKGIEAKPLPEPGLLCRTYSRFDVLKRIRSPKMFSMSNKNSGKVHPSSAMPTPLRCPGFLMKPNGVSHNFEKQHSLEHIQHPCSTYE